MSQLNIGSDPSWKHKLRLNDYIKEVVKIITRDYAIKKFNTILDNVNNGGTDVYEVTSANIFFFF